MVLRHRDSDRIIAGPAPWLELLGLLCFATGLFGLMLYFLMPEDVKRTFGFDLVLPMLLIMLGGWYAFCLEFMVFDGRDRSISIQRSIRKTEIWSIDDILYMDLRPVSVIPGPLCLWSCMFIRKYGNEQRKNVYEHRATSSRAYFAFELFTALSYRYGIPIQFQSPDLLLDRALELANKHPQRFEFRWLLCLLYDQLQKPRLAYEQIKQAVQIAPHETPLLHTYSILLNHLLMFDDALEPAKRAVELAPDDLVERHLYASLLYDRGCEDEAFEHAKIAYEQSDDDASMIHILYGELNLRRGNSAVGHAALERVLKRFSSISQLGNTPNPDELITRALAYARLERFDQAEADFVEPLKLAHVAPEVHVQYAALQCYRSRIQPERSEELTALALDHLEKAHKVGKLRASVLFDSDFQVLRGNTRYEAMLAELRARLDS